MIIIKFYLKETEIYSADKEDYLYYKDNMMKWLCENHKCGVEDITTKEVQHNDDESESFGCDECKYTECYDFISKDEHHEWDRYRYYGNPDRRLIQDIVPNMPRWMRETAIRVNIGCICPTCMAKKEMKINIFYLIAKIIDDNDMWTVESIVSEVQSDFEVSEEEIKEILAYDFSLDIEE